MTSKKVEGEKVEVNFEFHPPIQEDLDGISTLLRQTLLQYVDSSSLAKHLIELKDITQVIALEAPDEENTSEDDEPDNDIYGVSSVIELPTGANSTSESPQDVARKQLLKFLKDKSSEFKKTIEEARDVNLKIGMVVNERYINLPPQLALPTLKSLSKHLEKSKYTHLVFVSKILLKARETDTKLPSKKSKFGSSSGQDAEPLVFVNSEEEILSEMADSRTDLDVSSKCDKNATWSFSSDVKYTPHRRIMLIDFKKWPSIMENLEKELK